MNPFTYIRAGSAAEAVETVSAHREAKFLGGGTNLIDLMKMGAERPTHLVDITRVPSAEIVEQNGGLRIGAMARNREVAAHPLVRERFPVLSEALLSGANAQIRNMATMGGNLMQRTRCFYFYDPTFTECNKRSPGSGCAAVGGYNRIHAILGASEHCVAVHPSDMAVALTALDARVRVTGPRGERILPIEAFYRLPENAPQLDTNIHPDELITAIDLPALSFAGRSHYLKVRDRNSFAFALVSVAVALDLYPNGNIREGRIALGGVAHRPWRTPAAEAALAGQKADGHAFQAVAEELLRDAKPLRHNAFKVKLARRSIVRALTTAAAMS